MDHSEAEALQAKVAELERANALLESEINILRAIIKRCDGPCRLPARTRPDKKPAKQDPAIEAMLATPEPDGHVYLVYSAASNCVKIGHSTRIWSRMNSLKVDSAKLTCLVATMPGPPKLEAQLHRQFAEHHVRGEWFKPADEIFEAFGMPGKHDKSRWIAL